MSTNKTIIIIFFLSTILQWCRWNIGSTFFHYTHFISIADTAIVQQQSGPFLMLSAWLCLWAFRLTNQKQLYEIHGDYKLFIADCGNMALCVSISYVYEYTTTVDADLPYHDFHLLFWHSQLLSISNWSSCCSVYPNGCCIVPSNGTTQIMCAVRFGPSKQLISCVYVRKNKNEWKHCRSVGLITLRQPPVVTVVRIVFIFLTEIGLYF